MSGQTPRGNLNQAEQDWLDHVMRWGSDGYPVQKVGKRWIFGDMWGVRGTPTVYKTKREATAACARYEDVLIDKTAGRLE